MYMYDSNYAVSSWMERTVSARAASAGWQTDLDRAGRALAETRVGLPGLLSAIRGFFAAGTRRRRPLAALFDRDLPDLGLVRLQLTSTDDRVDDARWTAYDPRLPKVANSNARRGSRVA